MTTDPLTSFYKSFVEQVETRRDKGEFLRLLQEHGPGPRYRLSSEASGWESLISFNSRNLVITNVDKRQAAAVVSSHDLLGVEEPQGPQFASACVGTLMAQLREQMAPRPPPPSSAADPDRNPMWGEWTTTKHHETVASRTVVRSNDNGGRSLLQDRITVTVAIPELRLVVFAALIWERISASD